jgi:tetratricopeptide (TPR) repeat protein
VRVRLTLIAIGVITQSLTAQPVLSRSDAVLAKTCIGSAEAHATVVDAAQDVLVAVLADTLNDSELAQFRQQLMPFYLAARNKNPMRLARVSNGSVQFSGLLKTRAQLEAALNIVTRAGAESPDAAEPLGLYSYLGQNAQQFGSSWSSAIMIGHFPGTNQQMFAFAAGRLVGRFGSVRVRVSYWSPSGETSEVLDAVAAATGGMRLSRGLEDLLPALKDDRGFREISWQAPSLAAGFRACPVTLSGPDGQAVLTIPSIATAPGAVIPELERYALVHAKTEAIAAALKQASFSPDQAHQAEADLTLALEVSPREEETLRLGAILFKRQANDAKLAEMLDALAQVKPDEATVFEDLGHARYRMRDWDGADRALLRARDLKPGDAFVAEELARIRVTRGDDRAAVPFLDESLTARAGNLDLWLLRADVSTRLDDWRRTADSLEHAVALGSIPLDRRTSLVRLYIQHQMPDRALVQVRAVAENLPPDAAVRSEYAELLEDLQAPDEALLAWRRALEIDPALEPAHYRITKLQIGQNAMDAALQSADMGLEAAPRSARLYLAKAEVLEKQNRFYEARRTLRQAVPALPEPALLLRLAEMEDAGGENAAKYYRALAELGDASGTTSAARSVALDPVARSAALNHGLAAALRDGELDDVAWFRAKLGGAGAGVKAPSDARESSTTVPAITVPGGLAALSFIASSKPSPPENFLVEYARTVADHLQAGDKKEIELYAGNIREHFARIAELAAFGVTRGGQVKVTVSVSDRTSQQNAEKILELLGWRMRGSRQGVKLEVIEKGERAHHQETASALAIDEVGMQQALESGKPFSFDIPMEGANVLLGEEAWRSQFYSRERLPGGFAEAMAENLWLARTYAALGQMDPNTARILASGIGLRTLAEKYSSLLIQFSSALAVAQGRVAVPGGEAAETAWSSLAGADARHPDVFFRALLAKDNGKLLAYYAALSGLDFRHQRFFTRTPARTFKFYELFREAPETQRSSSQRIQAGSFVEFLSEVPLDTDGSVDFPGSPEVWMVAKGQSRSSTNVTKMMKKVRRTVAPDVEDEILLRLAGTRYKVGASARSELDNFLAVVRVDAHRTESLDEESALLLAQHFAEDEAAYPYFASLTGLQYKQFEEFFAFADALRSASAQDQDARIAAFTALVEMVCLSEESGRLSETQGAELVGQIVERLQAAGSEAERTAASLDLVRAILAHAGPQAASDPDIAMREMLLPPGSPAELHLKGATTLVDYNRSRGAQYKQVLELQKVPSLATVLALADAVRNLGAGKDAAAQIQVLESRASGLFVVEAPKQLQLKGKERELVEGFQPRKLDEIVKEFREKTAKKKVNVKDLEKLSYDYLKELDLPVRWALEGIIYACYLSPEDLLVSEDPLLLRKHRFVSLEFGAKTTRVFQRAYLIQSSEKAGSYFQGGFADFADAAGNAAALSAKLGGASGEFIASKQMAALRSTQWGRLRDEDLRLVGLKIAVSREWIVHAANQPDVQSALAEETLGLLSLTRRAELFSALAEGNWRSVWNHVTLSDSYFLADRFLERYAKDPWQSPALTELRQRIAHDDGARLQLLGAEFDETYGCSHPHLRSAPPYEEYEKDIHPSRLAERTAEFKLYLARYADSAGIPAAALGTLAEPAALVILKNMQVTDIHDWRSALAAYATLNDKVMEAAAAAR